MDSSRRSNDRNRRSYSRYGRYARDRNGTHDRRDVNTAKGSDRGAAVVDANRSGPGCDNDARRRMPAEALRMNSGSYCCKS